MSLILGFNLQDSVYLAADSRLTYETDAGILYPEDNWRKYHCFGSKLHCVVAGNARFASYLMQKISHSEQLDRDNFRSFESNIESYIKLEAGLYDRISEGPNAAFIFGGFDMRYNKLFNAQSIFDYLPQDGTVMQHRSLSEPIKIALVKHAMAQGKGTEIEAEGIPYSGLLGVEIRSSLSTGVTVAVRNVPHGKYIAFGEGGFTEHDISKQLYFDLELSPIPQGKTRGQIMIDNVCRITDFYYREAIPQQMTTKNNLSTVGGPIVVIWVTEHGGLFPAGTISVLDSSGSIIHQNRTTVKNGIVYIEIHGKKIEQKPVFGFFGSANVVAGAEI